MDWGEGIKDNRRERWYRPPTPRLMLNTLINFAQSVTVIRGGGGGGPNWGISWALILLAVALGMIITLKSPGRKTEFKKK